MTVSVFHIMSAIEKIHDLFDKEIIDDETFQNIVSYTERLQENNVPVIYNLRHVRKIFKIKYKEQNLFFRRKRKQLYRVFEIPKKSGGTRVIEAPTERLKAIQKWIKNEIIDSFSPSQYATGFRKKLSIVDNAKKHIGKELIVSFDIKDFFPSITYADVLKMFVYMGYKLDVAHLLTQLCTNGDDVLPQGSPASPSISNLILLKMDKRLGKLAEAVNCDYSRYADDITFSGDKKIKSIIPLVKSIITEEGFTVNEDKIRLRYSNQKQEVTGLIVNKKLSVSSELIKEIENAIYYCSKYGVESHMSHIRCDKSFYKEHLYGIAYFINMVDSQKGQKYLCELDKIIW